MRCCARSLRPADVLSREEIQEKVERASRMERERRETRARLVAEDVRALASSSSPRIRPDRSAVAAELTRLRSFHAHRDMKAIPIDVELIDGIIDLLGG